MLIISRILKSATNDLRQTRKATYIYTVHIGPRVPNFHPFRSTISHLQDIAHFTIFPLTAMSKFQSATIYFLAVCEKMYNFIFCHDCLIYNKFGSDRLKTVGIAFPEFSALYGPVLTKFQIAIGGLPKSNSLYSVMANILTIKFWWKLNENCGSSSLLKILTSEINK